MKLRKRRVDDVNLVAALLASHDQHDAVSRVDPLGVIERTRFIDIAVRTTRWSGVVREHGIPRGEHVVVLAERDRAWRAALLGVIEAGCVAVPFPGTAPADDIRDIAQDSGAALILAPHPRPDLDDGPAVVSADEVDMHRRAPDVNSGEPERAAQPDDPALVLYVRDGAAWRGAVHTHGSLLAQARAGERWLGLGTGESVWSTAPDGSQESIWLLLAAWHAGAQVIVVDQTVAPEAVLELLERLRPTALWLTDDEYRELSSPDVPSWINLHSIRRALADDAQAPGVVAFHELFGTAVAPVLGSPEAGMVAGCRTESVDEPEAEAAFRGIGLTVVDAQGRELRAGEVGDLAVAGAAPSLFAGYGRTRLSAPKENEWFRIGRRGSVDPDGIVRLGPPEPSVAPEEEPVDDENAGVAAHLAPSAVIEEEQARAKEAEEAEERKRAELAAVEERRRAEAAALEEDRRRAKAEAVEAKEREQAARAEEQRRADEAKHAQRRAEREAKDRAEADERRARDDEKRRKQLEREQRDAAKAEERRSSDAAKQAQREARREAKDEAEAEERRAREDEKRRKQLEREQRDAAKAEDRRRAEEAKHAQRRAEREAKERAEAEKLRLKEEEKQRKVAEREQREAAAAERRRQAAEAEQANRGAAAAEERRKAEAAEQAKREAEQKRRADELLRVEQEKQREEKRERKAAARAANERLAPDIRSMIDHYGFAGAPVDPDSRRDPNSAGSPSAFEDRATDSR